MRQVVHDVIAVIAVHNVTAMRVVIAVHDVIAVHNGITVHMARQLRRLQCPVERREMRLCLKAVKCQYATF